LVCLGTQGVSLRREGRYISKTFKLRIYYNLALSLI
jgi:hypothetical protein